MILKLAYLNLFRNKRRALSTGLAICIGFVGLNLLGAYIYRVKKALDTTSVYSALHGHVKIFKQDSLVQFALKPKKFIFQKNEIDQIEQIFSEFPEIEYTGKNINRAGLLSNGKISHPILFYSFEPTIYARSLTQPDITNWAKDWVLPSQFKNVEIFKNNNDVMSVTPKIADIMSLKYPLNENESLQLAGRSLDGDLNAVNLELGAEHTTGLQFLEDTLVLVPLAKVQELLGTDGAESISVYLKPNTPLAEFKKSLDQKLDGLAFKVDSYNYYDEKINAVYLGTIGFLVVMGAFFVFLIGTAVSLTIVNSLTMGIIERTREIGTLYAVGFKKREVIKLFIYENIILCGLAILVGVVLSFLFASLVNSLDIRFTPPSVTGKIQFRLVWNFTIALTVAAFTLTLTLISSFIVMKNKSKIKLIDLLNDSGA
ncbi:FtsX-like permease family protein [bacterium]|nr:FtsX-like permease family protein [bacterium]